LNTYKARKILHYYIKGEKNEKVFEQVNIKRLHLHDIVPLPLNIGETPQRR